MSLLDRRDRREVVRDRAWRLLGLMTTPLLPDDYLDLVAPLHTRPRGRGGGALRGRVTAVIPETADAATVVIRPGRGWAGHRPGQHVRIGLDIEGVRRWRTYSITSGPRSDGGIAITATAVPGGIVSTYLVRSLGPGTLLHLDQATGDFVFPTPAPSRVLFVTAGSGITPVMGMLRHHAAALQDVVVVHSAPAADDVIFGAELRALAAQGRIRLHEQHTSRGGRLTPDHLHALVPDWRERHTWACGPLPMLSDLDAAWSAAGLSRLLASERFSAPRAAAGSGGQVEFTATGAVVDADGSISLLDAGEAAGVLMPSGCRMGICYSCVQPLSAGSVRDLRTGAVTSAEPGDGVQVQTCVSAAAGPCSIDA